MRGTSTQGKKSSAKRKGASHQEAVLQEAFFPETGMTERMREDAIIEQAKQILSKRCGRASALDSPQKVRDWLAVNFGQREHEIFAVLFLDAQHRLIACEEMFRGTLTQTSVYPREIVKQCLFHNCAAVILAHNHPSGVAEPSRADESLTRCLQNALVLVDVRVLDHIVVGGAATTSFAERGLL